MTIFGEDVTHIHKKSPVEVEPTTSLVAGYFQNVMKVIVHYRFLRQFEVHNYFQITFQFTFYNDLQFYLNFSLAGCPNGYVERAGDVSGTGYKGTLSLTTEQCAQRCNDEKKCLSFETNPSEKKCNLNDIANPTRPKVPKYDYCIKSGTFIYLRKLCFANKIY